MKHTKKGVRIYWFALVLLVGACAGALYLRDSGIRRALAHERELCRKAGLPLSKAEWKSAHVPASQDAVPDYQAFDAALARHDLTDADEELAKHLSFGHAPTDSEAARLRSAFDSRRDVFAALDRALAKPLYSLGKDPDSQAIANEYAPMSRRREAVMLVCAQGILQAHAHQFVVGTQSVAKGYQISRQIGSISSLMGMPSADFMGTITSESMGVILRMGGADRRAAEAVRKALRSAPQRVSPAFAFGQSCGECDDLFRRLRGSNYDDFAASFPYGDPGRYSDPALWHGSLHGFAVRHLPLAYHAMVDSANAASLRTLRAIVAHSDQSYVEQRAWIRAERAALVPRDPAHAMPRLLLSNFESEGSRGALALAHRNVVLAAANVLVYRTRAGRLPRRLSEADPATPTDPFSGKPLRYRLDGKGGFTVSSVGQSEEEIAQRGYKLPPAAFKWSLPR